MNIRFWVPLLALAFYVPAAHAATVNATCKDGTTFSGQTKSGACRGHGGVKTWDTAAAAPATPAAAAGTGATSATTAAKPAATAAKPTTATSRTPPVPAATAALGAKPGDVWVNTAQKVYHCPGTKWYGKTKTGKYMTETEAKTAGYHAEHGKSCTS